MRRIITIVILSIVLYLSYSLVAQSSFIGGTGDNETTGYEEQMQQPEFPPQSTDRPIDLKDDPMQTDDEDLFAYDQDFFTRKFGQKKLSKLNNKKKIAWAFRMADANAFL